MALIHFGNNNKQIAIKSDGGGVSLTNNGGSSIQLATTNKQINVEGDGNSLSLGLPAGAPGKDGASAYEIAVENGFKGTEGEWLASLKGAKGEPGADGKQGAPGAQGPQGKDGDTPIKGVDYFTDEEIDAIVDEVFNLIDDGKDIIAIPGPQGEDGGYYFPTVNDDGFLSWQPSLEDMPIPAPAYIRGPQGTQGPQGEAGPRGFTGEQGPPGERGEQGIQGEPGAKGEKGEKGDKGEPGERGADGAPGADGAQGPRGYTGERGPQGERGEQGPPGADGTPGERGLQGPPGEQGPRGEQGIPGPQGEQGPIGPQGPKGDKGDKGDKGADGTITFTDLTEEQKASLKGEKGDKGDVGPEGPRGEIGPQGPVGEQGPRGYQGEPGPQGEKGDTGSAGPKGDTGPRGYQGEKGEPGYTPVKGIDYFTNSDMANIITEVLHYGDFDSKYQNKTDYSLNTEAKTIVEAINEINDNSVDNITSIETWTSKADNLTLSNSGITWKDTYEMMTTSGWNNGNFRQRLPIVAGDNISFTIDDTNKVFKISANGTGSSDSSVRLHTTSLNKNSTMAELITELRANHILATDRVLLHWEGGNSALAFKDAFVKIGDAYAGGGLVQIEWLDLNNPIPINGVYSTNATIGVVLQEIEIKLHTNNKEIAGAINEVYGDVIELARDIELTGYQLQFDNSLLTNDKSIVGAINEVREDSLSSIVNIDTYSGKPTDLFVSPSFGITYRDRYEIYTNKGSHSGTSFNRLPLVAGDNITFEEDWTNKVVRVNSTGGGGSPGRECLPSYSAADEGKFLKIVNGAPAWEAIEDGDEVEY